MAKIKNPLTIVQSGGGTLDNYGTVTYTDNGVDKTITLTNEDDFYALCSGAGSSSKIVINGTEIVSDFVKEIVVADGVESLPDKFGYALGLTSVTLPSSIHTIGTAVFYGNYINSPLNLTNVAFIGDSFMQANAVFNQSVSLPNVLYIGNSFLRSCTSFNSTLTLNDNTRKIGDSFMQGCSAFAQPFIIPSGLRTETTFIKNPGESFFKNCDNFTGPLVCNGPVSSLVLPNTTNTLTTTSSTAATYTTGVTLTGPYAQAWKDALPDRTSSPYRKLIVAS